jgi:hypothetical protein
MTDATETKAGGGGSQPAFESTTANPQCNRAARTAQVARIRLIARSLDYSPVFVSDAPIVAELFDTRGNLAGCWGPR